MYKATFWFSNDWNDAAAEGGITTLG